MLLSKLLAKTGIEYKIVDEKGNISPYPIPNIEIGELFCDSRCVVKEGLYIAIDGLHTDSHAHVGEAASHGAIAAIVSYEA